MLTTDKEIGMTGIAARTEETVTTGEITTIAATGTATATAIKTVISES
jgi:hypothetical protein